MNPSKNASAQYLEPRLGYLSLFLGLEVSRQAISITANMFYRDCAVTAVYTLPYLATLSGLFARPECPTKTN